MILNCTCIGKRVFRVVDIDDLAEDIARELQAYSEEVTERMKKDVTEVAKECLKEIVNNAPELSGDYKKGWKVKKAYESDSDIRIIIHNKKRYRLTHLLEYGHVKVGGGRVEGKPHIALAEANAKKKLLKRVKVSISGSDS